MTAGGRRCLQGGREEGEEEETLGARRGTTYRPQAAPVFSTETGAPPPVSPSSPRADQLAHQCTKSSETT